MFLHFYVNSALMSWEGRIKKYFSFPLFFGTWLTGVLAVRSLLSVYQLANYRDYRAKFAKEPGEQLQKWSMIFSYISPAPSAAYPKALWWHKKWLESRLGINMSTAWVHRDFERPLVDFRVFGPLTTHTVGTPWGHLSYLLCNPSIIWLINKNLQWRCSKQMTQGFKEGEKKMVRPSLWVVWSRNFNSMIFKILNDAVVGSLSHRSKRQVWVEVCVFFDVSLMHIKIQLI